LFRFGQSAGGCLLVLNRLAFPPTSHPQIIRRILGVHWLPISRHSRALRMVVLAVLAAVTPVSTIKCVAWKAVWGYCSAYIFAREAEAWGALRPGATSHNFASSPAPVPVHHETSSTRINLAGGRRSQ
jgi:hypothetical protein